jgi:serine/threonine-protein kinase RsbT
MTIQQQREVQIRSDNDIVATRRTVREVAQSLGFGITDVTRIVTATSELARNVVLYAGSGVMRWREIGISGNVGVELTLEDNGPGIANIEQVMQEGYTTSGGLGLGLPGSKRLMDEFEIASEIGKGTRITVRKWRRQL